MVSVTVAIIVTLALSRCQGFLLRLTPEFIDTQITERVILTCLPGGRTSIDTPIINMRILKGETNHWKMIAEMENNKTDITVYEKNLFSSGRIGNMNDSDLTITWPVVTTNILGTYRCDVQGFKSNGDVILENSQEIVISERNATVQNVLQLIKEEKENNEDELKAMSKRIENINELLRKTSQGNTTFNDPGEIFGELETTMRNVTVIIAKQFEELSMRVNVIEENQKNVIQVITENLTEISQNMALFEAVIKNLTRSLVQRSVFDSLTEKVPSVVDTGTKQIWPQGYFGLMATSEGCPVNGSDIWVSGYRRHHIQSTYTKLDQISPSNHFLQPLREDYGNQNFIYQHFCMRISSDSDYYWPNGSYCSNKYTQECPYNFKSGYITWDDEDTDSSSSTSGTLPQGEYNPSWTTIYYCCRSDGPATVPVNLPKDKPFFLYRYKGKCQQVYGMNVTEENILFDTENTSNRDKYESEVHPDGQAHSDVRLILCYYSPI